MTKIDYGVDAPKVIRNLCLIAVILFGSSVVFPVFRIGGITINVLSFDLCCGSTCLLFGLLMLMYAKIGKFKHCDRMLKLINWTGNETVLDIGTGRGLLMIGAAKKLSSGKSVGIDIWNKEDLSNNSAVKTMLNAELEGVKDRIEIKDENILHTNFEDNFFDVVLTNLCLHNIYNKEGRMQACKEIHRILKPQVIAIISDFKHINEYKKEFLNSGMTVAKIGTFYFDTFPPLTIIKAVKN